jgi:hypothetical protein
MVTSRHFRRSPRPSVSIAARGGRGSSITTSRLRDGPIHASIDLRELDGASRS